MKTNTVGYFEIQSSNPKREIEFYENLFGWKFTKDEALTIEYYRIETKGINGGLLKRSNKTPTSHLESNAFVCSVQVENFDKSSSEIVRLGGKVTKKKFAIPGRCWQGYFLDQDNNSFGIFEVDLNA